MEAPYHGPLQTAARACSRKIHRFAQTRIVVSEGGAILRSESLASVLTEWSARVRLLGATSIGWTDTAAQCDLAHTDRVTHGYMIGNA